MNYDWTMFKKQVFINADAAKVFDAWAIPQALETWFIASASYTHNGQRRAQDDRVEAGDAYHWRWHQNLETSGTIKNVIPNEQIVFTFGNLAPHHDDILVTVSVESEEDGCTRLTLVQENMPDKPEGQHYHLSCNLGWSFFMTNLKGVLEHGVDLRETDPHRAAAARAISVAS